jgi:hypothetical protein
LGGRYAVTLRTSAGAHHERWRASDHTLEREVVLVCFPAGSSVAPAALDAARRAAGIEDPRLVRVLDVGSDHGVGFIVEEPLTGAIPMSHLLQSGGLPPEEVRRLVGEAASALERARHRGLHHLALSPSAILRMPDGEVKVRGLATEAALTGADAISDERASRVDAVGLVKITYAGLTARWPRTRAERERGGADVGLEAAPTMIGGVAAPSEYAAGVPNDLDLICRMTLNDGRGPISPGDLALQIAPWPAEPQVSDGASGVRLPASREEQHPTRIMPAVSPAAGAGAGAAPGAVGSTEVFDRVSVGPDGRPVGPGASTAAPPPRQGSDAGAPVTLAAAGAAAAGVAGSIGDRVGSFARAAAERASARAAERRHAHDDFEGEDIHLTDALEAAPQTELEPAVPVFGHGVPEAPSGTQSRIALAIVGALVIVALVIGINNVAKIGQHEAGPTAQTVTVTASRPKTTSPSAGTSTAQPPTTTEVAPVGAVSITGGTGFDPQDDNTEADQNAKLAFDDDPDTKWRSRWYGSDDYNGRKDGVGLVLDLSDATAIKEVELLLPAAQDVTVYASNDDSLDGAQEIGSVKKGEGRVTVTAESATQPATKLIIWVTKAAPDEAPDHYRAQVSEVMVR